MDEAPKPRALTAAAAAAYLGGEPITAETMLSLARRKKVGHVKVGRATTFPIEALDAYVRDHTVAPTENPWGLTDGALANVRSDRPARARRPA